MAEPLEQTALLTLTVPASALELAYACVWEYAPAAVEERDGTTMTQAQQPDAIEVIATFDEPEALEACRAACAAQWPTEVRVIEGRPWLEVWRSFFKPVHIADALTIVAPWQQAPAKHKHVVIDPGLAFGTGQHVTTRLLAQRIVADAPMPERVLDVGAGSGVLAFAALHFGAKAATLVEVEADARRAARENAERNGMAAALVDVLPDLDAVTEQFPVVFANIQLEVLRRLAPALMARTAPGGRLYLSGLLADEIAAMRAEFPASWRSDSRLDEGWGDLVLTAPEA